MMSFEEQLAAGLEGVVVVMGIGNTLRGDDAAGSLMARQIVCPPGSSVIDAQDCPEDFLPQVMKKRPDTIILIDSVDLGSAPGSVAFLRREQFDQYRPSTHRMPIGLLMEILERETHARVVTIGVQPGHTEYFKSVSEPVRTTVSHLADILNNALAKSVPAGSPEKEVLA